MRSPRRPAAEEARPSERDANSSKPERTLSEPNDAVPQGLRHARPRRKSGKVKHRKTLKWLVASADDRIATGCNEGMQQSEAQQRSQVQASQSVQEEMPELHAVLSSE